MKNTLKLHNPITIDNKQVSELTYDTNEITATLYAEADAKRRVAAGVRNVSIAPAVEFEYGLHLYLGFAAIIAVNPGYDFSAMERIKGADIPEVQHIGRTFIMKSEDFESEPSDEPSATIPEPSTQASESSDDNL